MNADAGKFPFGCFIQLFEVAGTHVLAVRVELAEHSLQRTFVQIFRIEFFDVDVFFLNDVIDFVEGFREPEKHLLGVFAHALVFFTGVKPAGWL